MEKQIFNWK